VTRWRSIVHELTFPIPQVELTHLFSKIYAKHIWNTLKIQTLPSFEEAIKMAKRIKDLNVQNGDVKLWNKQDHTKKKGPFTTPSQPQINQVTLSQPYISQTNPRPS